jgi:putative ABC transport system ATP-binding protein
VVLKSVSRVYETKEEQTKALDKASLAIARGGVVALVGPSGSGKTTLLNMIAAFDFPTEGTVTVDGRTTSELKGAALQSYRNEVVGMVFQQFFLVDHLSVLENVMIPLLPRHVPSEDKMIRAVETLDRVGLGGKMKRLPAELSGGELQRVAIARAIAGDPKVILADEPTGNLDLKKGLEIVDILKSEGQKGKTVVIATHDPRILEHVEGVGYLEDGVLTRVEGRSLTA